MVLSWAQICQVMTAPMRFVMEKRQYQQGDVEPLFGMHGQSRLVFTVERVTPPAFVNEDLVLAFVRAVAQTNASSAEELHHHQALVVPRRKDSADTVLSAEMDEELAQMTLALDAMLCVGRWNAQIAAEGWWTTSNQNEPGSSPTDSPAAALMNEDGARRRAHTRPPVAPVRGRRSDRAAVGWLGGGGGGGENLSASGAGAARFPCETCGMRFKRRHDARRHERETHKKCALLTCPDCPRTFSRDSNLRRHQLSVHENRREFSCTLCSSSFTSRGNLDRHYARLHNSKISNNNNNSSSSNSSSARCTK